VQQELLEFSGRLKVSGGLEKPELTPRPDTQVPLTATAAPHNGPAQFDPAVNMRFRRLANFHSLKRGVSCCRSLPPEC